MFFYPFVFHFYSVFYSKIILADTSIQKKIKILLFKFENRHFELKNSIFFGFWTQSRCRSDNACWAPTRGPGSWAGPRIATPPPAGPAPPVRLQEIIWLIYENNSVVLPAFPRTRILNAVFRECGLGFGIDCLRFCFQRLPGKLLSIISPGLERGQRKFPTKGDYHVFLHHLYHLLQIGLHAYLWLIIELQWIYDMNKDISNSHWMVPASAVLQ